MMTSVSLWGLITHLKSFLVNTISPSCPRYAQGGPVSALFTIYSGGYLVCLVYSDRALLDPPSISWPPKKVTMFLIKSVVILSSALSMGVHPSSSPSELLQMSVAYRSLDRVFQMPTFISSVVNIIVELAVLIRVPFVSISFNPRGFSKVEMCIVGQINVFT